MTNRRERAAQQFSAWRDQGIPMVVTAAEAWKLTGGKVGAEGDHETPMNLSTVATRLNGVSPFPASKRSN
jgi:hypothetical protein